jgi:hypothetical protein
MKKWILALTALFAAASLQAGDDCCEEKCDASKTAKTAHKAESKKLTKKQAKQAKAAKKAEKLASK